MTRSQRVVEAFLHEISDIPEFADLPRPTVHSRGRWGNTPLKVAAVRGDSAVIGALIEAGADINARNEDDYTALHHAVSQGHFEAAKRLLELGADPTLRDRFGKRPADYAERSDLQALFSERRH